MAYSISRRKNKSVMSFVGKLLITIALLYAGGRALASFGSTLNNTASPFYDGLTLIGWTISDVTNTSGSVSACGTINSCPAGIGYNCPDVNNCITSTSGTGLLVVVGILAMLYVVLSMFQIKRT